MALVLVTGGARSGKTALAEALAARRGAAVTFVATGEAGDEEMAARIARHRAARPAGWRTVEEPLDVAAALTGAGDDTVVLDCLSLWLANLMAADAVPDPAVAELAARRGALTIAVTNEVGMGVVPATPLGREYRDALGVLNATWARNADHALLAVAGRALVLSDADELVGRLAG